MYVCVYVSLCLTVLGLLHMKITWEIREYPNQTVKKERDPLTWRKVALVVKNPPDNARDVREMGWIPGLGRSPAGGNGIPLQYSCWEDSMDRGAWRCPVHGVKELDTTEHLSTTWRNISPNHRKWNFEKNLHIEGKSSGIQVFCFCFCLFVFKPKRIGKIFTELELRDENNYQTLSYRESNLKIIHTVVGWLTERWTSRFFF